LPDAYAKPPPYRASTLAQPTLQSHPKGSWVFLTNHAPVLLCVARAPQAGTPDIAEQVQITERATQRILADLIAHGYVTRTKVGQRTATRSPSPAQRSGAFVCFECGEIRVPEIEQDTTERESASG